MTRIGRFPLGGGTDFSHAEMRMIEAATLAPRIPNFNANVPDRAFIATAGLTPGSAIIKPKFQEV